MPSFNNLIYEKRSRVAYVTVNRPKALNALNQATLAEIREAMDAARTDTDVGGVIITGAGDKAFAAGADIAEIASISVVQACAFTRYGQSVFDCIENLGKPVIAAVNGYALGGGCELALACTVRLATPSARFGQPEVKLGVIPGFGGTQRLPRLIGKGHALQMILTGDPIDALEAHRIGLVNEVVEPAQLMARAEALLQKIMGNAPLALRFAMEAVNHGLRGSPVEGMVMESAMFSICTASADKQEGTAAFLEKRAPRFTGT
jgi:enoyl-CoA hydratase